MQYRTVLLSEESTGFQLIFSNLPPSLTSIFNLAYISSSHTASSGSTIHQSDSISTHSTPSNDVNQIETEKIGTPSTRNMTPDQWLKLRANGEQIRAKEISNTNSVLDLSIHPILAIIPRSDTVGAEYQVEEKSVIDWKLADLENEVCRRKKIREINRRMRSLSYPVSKETTVRVQRIELHLFATSQSREEYVSAPTLHMTYEDFDAEGNKISEISAAQTAWLPITNIAKVITPIGSLIVEGENENENENVNENKNKNKNEKIGTESSSSYDETSESSPPGVEASEPVKPALTRQDDRTRRRFLPWKMVPLLVETDRKNVMRNVITHLIYIHDNNNKKLSNVEKKSEGDVRNAAQKIELDLFSRAESMIEFTDISSLPRRISKYDACGDRIKRRKICGGSDAENDVVGDACFSDIHAPVETPRDVSTDKSSNGSINASANDWSAIPDANSAMRSSSSYPSSPSSPFLTSGARASVKSTSSSYCPSSSSFDSASLPSLPPLPLPATSPPSPPLLLLPPPVLLPGRRSSSSTSSSYSFLAPADSSDSKAASLLSSFDSDEFLANIPYPTVFIPPYDGPVALADPLSGEPYQVLHSITPSSIFSVPSFSSLTSNQSDQCSVS